MAREWRVYGPPGTGKTTFLSRQVAAAVQKHGSRAVIVASFTRAAAAELAGRNLPLDREQIGTLHAHCYRALHRPKIAETCVEDWNSTHPALRLSFEGGKLDEAAVDQIATTPADATFQQYQVLRARLRPRELWPLPVQAFAKRWEEWKASGDLLDFTDLIETALRECPRAPGEPSIGFFDEVQDFTALELALVRRWGERMETVLLAGDDDQAIYSFKGADAEAFLDPPLPPEQLRILPQSYRVPQVVQAHAERWVRKLTRRQPKEYRPRDEAGELRRLNGATWQNPEEALEDAQRYLQAGRSVMFLAACGYMLAPLVAVLRDAGTPFHNPYRVSRGDWNPLQSSGVSSAQRLLAYMLPNPEVYGIDARVWTPEEIRTWSDPLKVKGFLKRGARIKVEEMTGDGPADMVAFGELMEDEAILPVSSCDLDWYEGQLVASRKKGMAFPLAVARRHGGAKLLEEPKIILGTIHSVKGGQADVVYLFPDLSTNGMREWLTPGAGRDSVVRQFYVGMTRPREALILPGPSGPCHIPWEGVS